MNEYRYPKSGYTLLAVKLLYGQRSPHVEQFSVFQLPPHDANHLRYSEEEHAREASLGPGINSCSRSVSFGSDRSLSSTLTQGTGINTGLSYSYQMLPWNPLGTTGRVEVLSGRSIHDSIFSQREYEYFDQHWDTQVQFKVDALSRLIRALDTGDENLYPTFVADFPQIAAYLLSTPNPVPKKKPIWP